MPARTQWTLADQALSSLTNAAVTVVVARSLPPRTFGAFALAFTLYELAVALSRALTSEPLVVRFSAATGPERRMAVRQATGAAFAMGSVAGAACLAAGLALDGPVREALVPLGALLPFLLVQDAWRFAFFSSGQPARAFLNDLAWTGAQSLFLAGVIAIGRPTVAALVSAWAAAAAVAAACGCVQFGGRPEIGEAARWLKDHRDLGSRFAAEFAARAGARQVTILALGAIGGFEALGAIRATQVVFGPLHVVLIGANLFAVPEAVRLAGGPVSEVRRFSMRLSATLAALGFCAGLGALLLPGSAGRALVGETWTAARPVLLPQAAIMAGLGASAGALTGLRALAAANRSLAARLLIVPLSVGGGVAGAVVGGAPGAMTGLALANWLGAAVFWRQFDRALGERAEAGGTRGAATSRPPRSRR